MNFNNCSVMILAAGYGSRLKPITKKIPKPLVKVAEKSLLQNLIDFLLNLKFHEIIINTHYKSKMIDSFIHDNYKHKNIFLSHEKDLLDTAGGVKNALPLFKKKISLIINCDIFLTKYNINDIKKLIKNFDPDQKCKLLLVPKKKAHGIYNKKGDFTVISHLVKRYNDNNSMYYYSGVQVISLDILRRYKQKKLSFNKVWDDLIKNKSVFAEIMNSDWYHVGNIQGLKEAEDFIA